MIKINDVQKKKDKDYAIKSVEDAFIVKDVDLKKKIVTGLYNSFNFFDSDYDVILPGAAQKSISERGPNSQAVCKIKHLLFHDWKQLPGKITTLEEKEVTVGNRAIKGIYFETQMMDTTIGIDTIINYQNNVYDNHSIGFQFLDGEWIDKESDNWDAVIGKLLNPQAAEDAGFAYLWKEIKLYEGSTVAFGANELTPYLGVKDLENKDALVLKVLDRINILQSQVSKGVQSDEMLESFDMQTKQLKQIIRELFEKGPSAKLTPKKGPGKKDTEQMIHCDGCGGDFDAQNMTPDDSGAYACPDCNQLCMSKAKNPLEFLKNIKFI